MKFKKLLSYVSYIAALLVALVHFFDEHPIPEKGNGITDATE
jgi:hypothetical protein